MLAEAPLLPLKAENLWRCCYILLWQTETYCQEPKGDF